MAASGQTMAYRVQTNAISAIRVYEFGIFKHVLPAFADIERKSNQVADEEFSRIGSEPADEDCSGDMAAAAESAEARGNQFYELMTSVRQTMLNLVAAGLFHLLEQQLTDLCRDPLFFMDPPDSNLDVTGKWFHRHFGMDIRSFAAWRNVDELRYLANAIKHAEGGSAQELRRRRPALFRNPVFGAAEEFLESAGVPPLPVCSPLTGIDLYVTEEILRDYCSSALSLFEEMSAAFEARGQDWYPIART